ncbi:myelin-oligodendrocyte glycoprotein-like isoform 2-T3 [Pholidichthys leucotaenia]
MAPLCTIFTLLCLISISEGHQEVKVQVHQDTVLPCSISKNQTVSVLKWSRPELNGDGYVYFYRNRRVYHNYQHPSFQGRIELREPQMKNGDVSLILRNVTLGDSGTYECYTSLKSGGHSKRDETSHFIRLTVMDGSNENRFDSRWQAEEQDGNHNSDQTTAGLVFAAGGSIVVVAVAVLLRWQAKKGKKRRHN